MKFFVTRFIKIEQYHLNNWTLRVLEQAAYFFRNSGSQAYLVGGSVRNLLLHEPCNDWDIVTNGDYLKLGRQLANELGGYYAPMHEKACRIIVKHDQQELVIDLSPLQGGSIEADLQLRDFTLNAIAIPLVNLVEHLTANETLTFIDPMNGVADLEAHILRAVNDRVFRDDPLRLLRAMRFLMRYQLTLESQTEQMTTRDASLLSQVAGARIHEELYTILQPAGATAQLRFLDGHGLLTALIPEFIPARGMPQPALHYWDVLEHSLESVGALERLATLLQQTPLEATSQTQTQHACDLSPSVGTPIDYQNFVSVGESWEDLMEIQQLLFEAEQQDIFHFSTLTAPVTKLATLLHDIGKPVTYAVNEEGTITFYHHPQRGIPLAQAITQRLNASVRDRRLVQQIVAHHMRPGQLKYDQLTERAIRRYFVDLGPTGIIVALVSLADHLAMRGPQPLTEHWEGHLATVRLLLTRYIRERKRILPPRLIQANELMQRFNLEPGPIVGQVLESIAEQQADGHLQSKEEAFWFIEETFDMRRV
ncbi:MAG TPA: HD domain-containing protein [Ktedonobacteraceae bacterium]